MLQPAAPWQCLYLRPDPQGHGALRLAGGGTSPVIAAGVAVARILHSQGLTWEQMRLSSAGSADSHTDREYDREANRVNQRVEVIVTADLVK